MHIINKTLTFHLDRFCDSRLFLRTLSCKRSQLGEIRPRKWTKSLLYCLYFCTRITLNWVYFSFESKVLTVHNFLLITSWFTTHIVFIVEIVNLDNFERKIKVDRSMSVENVLHLNRMTLNLHFCQSPNNHWRLWSRRLFLNLITSCLHNVFFNCKVEIYWFHSSIYSKTA